MFGNSTAGFSAGGNQSNTAVSNGSVSGGSLFSKPNPSNTTSSGLGLFGNNTQTPSQPGGLFASSTGNNTLGASQQQQQQQQQTGQSGFGSSLFGNNSTQQQAQPSATTSSSLFSSNNQLQNSNQNQAPGLTNSIFKPAGTATRTSQPNNVTEQLVKIKEAWDPTSPNCAFQYYFYNKVPANEVMLYVKPPEQDQMKWDQAMNEKPDATSVPVLAVGFTDLQKRMATQEQQVDSYRARIHELNNKLNELTSRHDLNTTVKIAEMQAKHAELAHKTLKLAVKAQVLRNRGLVLRNDEEGLKEKLEKLSSNLEDPAIYGRINEIWARMTALREMARVMNSRGEERLDEYNLDWDLQEEQLERIAKILKDQQAGIAYLSKILTEDQEEMQRIVAKLEKK